MMSPPALSGKMPSWPKRLITSPCCLSGHDGKEGWLSSQLGKVMLYDRCADALRNGEVVLHAFAMHAQLASIDGSTLRAPEGEHDDRADAFALACAGRTDAGSVWVESPFDRNAVGMMHPANVPVGVFMSMDEELGRGLWGPGGSLGRPW